MSEPVANNDDLGFEGTLKYTQQVRRKVIEHYTANNVIPTDTREVGMLLKALDGMDRTALEERKTSIEQDTANSSKKVAEAMSELIKAQKNRNPFMRTDDEPEGKVPDTPAEVLGNYELVPGETDIGIIAESADSFFKRMDAQKESDV
jgi:hypothetical protein